MISPMFQEAEERVRALVREEVDGLRREFDVLRRECEQFTQECRRELQEQRRWLTDALARVEDRLLQGAQHHPGQHGRQQQRPLNATTSDASADRGQPQSFPASSSSSSSAGNVKLPASSVRRSLKTRDATHHQQHQQHQHQETANTDVDADEDGIVPSTAVVTLNVGGSLFSTLASTLRRVPDSFFDIMLSGRHPVARDEAGHIFIDRNSVHFPVILDWLRDPGSPQALPFNDAEFLHELEYYGLADAVLGDWTTSEPDLTAVTGGVYAIGSESPNERYDMDRNIWYPVADLLQPRTDCKYTWFNNRLYAIGGRDRQRVYAAVERFDPRKNNWVPVPDMHHARRSVACAILHGQLYVIGGLDHDGRCLAFAERYDPDTRTWEELPPLQQCAGPVACVVVRGRLYVFGGSEMLADPRSYVPVNAVEMYDEEHRTWVARAPMPQPRYELHAAVVRTEVVIVGGLASSSTASALSRTDIYSTETDTWRSGRDMRLQRFSVACCDTIGNMVYVAGGSNPVALETVERYDLDTDTWTILPNMSQHRHFFSAAVFQGRLLTVGGMTYRRDRRSQRVGASMPVTTVEAYDPATNKWYTLAPLNNARAHGVCVTASSF
ncbi:hypothetical protein PTSG_01961 [Salpingoeca rosetta]|uniref:BTB domain-containing protein n=1 Tax=Salpingoeca rosetta (strain ATCC 50818 / BSB-021) TaxID=946362 RepID=F2TZG6_SALR5|nr:uncharacterized protein PTSG_01961 [Salpingoeca rosetta]EGD78990.1 hypothetical protein PTSG_01961 [Salpingoeca rosetta]|eukprot:XP_004997946.1 hypothetical protein PTSG_01961 [Salpingoeca rosetta]